MRNTLIVLGVVILLGFTTAHSQSRKQTNWLDDKKSHITRWRVGVGFAVAEPTNFHVQLYRLRGICTQTIRIRKMLSVNLLASYEGLLLGEYIAQQNELWTNGGARAGLDFLFYIPVGLSPYIGVGADVGNRTFDGAAVLSPDAIGRLGIEAKVLGIRTSNKSQLHASLFAEAKYSYGLKQEFASLLPLLGLRVHFL